MELLFFFFQAEDGIRYLVRSRGLGDVYKRQVFITGMFVTIGKVVLPISVSRLENEPAYVLYCSFKPSRSKS